MAKIRTNAFFLGKKEAERTPTPVKISLVKGFEDGPDQIFSRRKVCIKHPTLTGRREKNPQQDRLPGAESPYMRFGRIFSPLTSEK